MRYALPFEVAEGSNVISSAGIVAPVWAKPGTEIVAVNNVEVGQMSDIQSVLSGLVTSDDIGSIPTSFVVKAEGETVVSINPWTVPVNYETVLSDGTAFETSKVGDTWQTRVAAVSETAGELQVGDVIVAYVPTSEPVTDHTVLQDILEREATNGTKQMNFAVTRDGSMWVVAMTYAEGA